MTPQQMRAAYPLISTSPDYPRYLAAKRRRELHDGVMRRILLPVTIICSAIAGAHEEHQQMIAAPAIYLGTAND